MKYVDLHIHPQDKVSNKSGESIEEILKEAIENDTYTLAFTSHNTLKQYYDLYNVLKNMKQNDSQLYNKVINNMNFAIGCEIDSRIEDNDNIYTRHMLVYNIQIEKIDEVQNWLENNTNKDLKAVFQLAQLMHFKSTADELKIPYEKDRIISNDMKYAGMVFATAVKDKVDNMLADILDKDTPISRIFEKEVEKDERAKSILSKYEEKRDAYKEIINTEDIIKNNENIALIKHLYYQIIDLRLFASQPVNVDEKESADSQIKSAIKLMEKD